MEIEDRVVMGQWDEALDLALSAWRETRAPAYANLVEAISAKIIRAAIPSGSRLGWLLRARSRFAVDVPVLLDALAMELSSEEWEFAAAYGRRRPLEASLREQVYARTTGARMAAALARENLTLDPDEDGPFVALSTRIEALAMFGHDPRIARGLVRFLKLAPFAVTGAAAVATYGPAFDLVEEIGDVRVLPALEALPESTARDRVVQSLRAIVVPPLPNEKEVAALATDLGYSVAAEVVDVAELLALVVRDFDDDTPRVVLADRWLEAGDPRGEFVSLQLRAAQGEASNAELERMASLQAQGESEWLGELVLLTRERRFFRGFLDEFELAGDGTLPSERWLEVLRDARLGTVRAVRCGEATPALYRRILEAPALVNLEEIEVATPATVKDLVQGSLRLAKLRRVELTMALRDLARARELVSTLAELGLVVSVTYERPSGVAEHASLLMLATEKASVVLRSLDACFTSTRAAGGLALDIVSRDARLVIDVMTVCPGATLALRRPRGAKLFTNGNALRLLAERLPASAKLDASWREALKR